MNVGCIERFVRIFAGVAIFGMTLTGDVGCWGYLGIVLIGTGLSGMCPLSFLLGINTNRCAAEAKH